MSFKSSLFFTLPESIQKRIARFYLEYFLKNKIDLKVKNYQNIEKLKSPIIFIANHLSNIDGVILNRVLRDFNPFFVAGEKLSSNKFTHLFLDMFQTIKIKPNSADIESMKKIVNTLKNGDNIMIFPEGTRSRVGSMIEAKKGIILMAKLSKAIIVPISIMGTEKIFPIDKDGKMENERLTPGRVDVIFGEPFYLMEKSKEDSKEQYEKRALNDIMHRIAVNLDEKYRGVYSLNE